MIFATGRLTSFSLISSASVLFPDSLREVLSPYNLLPDSASFTSLLVISALRKESLSVWQLLVSILGSLGILAVIILCLGWKTNFFKRNADDKKKEVQVKEDFDKVRIIICICCFTKLSNYSTFYLSNQVHFSVLRINSYLRFF